MPQFGDKFRKAREAKKLSLDDVSRVTKIGSRMLQAIEDEHFDVLPGGVFNKGFIRAYAKHLGLNDEEAVTDYLGALRQAQIEANEFRDPHIPAVRPPAAAERRTPPMTVTSAPAKPPAPQLAKAQALKPGTPVEVEELPELQLPRAADVRTRRPNYPGDRDTASWRIVTAVAIVVILAVTFFWMRHRRATHTEATDTAQPTPASTLPAATTQPAPPTSTTTTPAQPKPNTAPTPSKSVTEPSSQSTVPKPTATPKPAAEHATQPAPAADKPAPAPARPVSEAKSAPRMTLVIRATENSWISVLSDGQLVSQETLIAPANTTIHATREITVRIGNAAGVSFVWNGQEVPVQGAEAEVKTLVFDANGMRAASPQPAQ